MPAIHDVVVKKLVTYPDDRGYFREVLREDDHLLKRFGQTAVTKSYPGVIKAFHWHQHQDDLWYIVDGMARVVLYDRRPDSPTRGVGVSAARSVRGIVDQVTELTARFDERTGSGTDALRSAALSAPPYFVSMVLTIFLLLFGRRMLQGGLDQLSPQRRERLDKRGFHWSVKSAGFSSGSAASAFCASFFATGPRGARTGAGSKISSLTAPAESRRSPRIDSRNLRGRP